MYPWRATERTADGKRGFSGRGSGVNSVRRGMLPFALGGLCLVVERRLLAQRFVVTGEHLRQFPPRACRTASAPGRQAAQAARGAGREGAREAQSEGLALSTSPLLVAHIPRVDARGAFAELGIPVPARRLVHHTMQEFCRRGGRSQPCCASGAQPVASGRPADGRLPPSGDTDHTPQYCFWRLVQLAGRASGKAAPP